MGFGQKQNVSKIKDVFRYLNWNLHFIGIGFSLQFNRWTIKVQSEAKALLSFFEKVCCFRNKINYNGRHESQRFS